MSMDLQKASMWKRISAYLFDIILLATLAVAAAFALSAALGYDGYSAQLNAGYAKYEAQYGLTFDITASEYEALSKSERENYDAAYNALSADAEVIPAYNMVMNLSLVITTLGILIATMFLEFVAPRLFGNGQTLGKKIFGIGLMRTDGVKINTMQLLIRTLLGKFTIETMIPVYLLVMMFMGTIGVIAPAILGALLLGQIISVTVTRTNSAIHDLLAGTVVVDIASQQIFHSTEELIAYTKQRHAQEAARKPY